MSLYLMKAMQLDNEPQQVSFCIGLAANTLAMPWIIRSARSKIHSILNPDINHSYSKISVRILKILIV